MRDLKKMAFLRQQRLRISGPKLPNAFWFAGQTIGLEIFYWSHHFCRKSQQPFPHAKLICSWKGIWRPSSLNPIRMLKTSFNFRKDFSQMFWNICDRGYPSERKVMTWWSMWIKILPEEDCRRISRIRNIKSHVMTTSASNYCPTTIIITQNIRYTISETGWPRWGSTKL